MIGPAIDENEGPIGTVLLKAIIKNRLVQLQAHFRDIVHIE